MRCEGEGGCSCRVVLFNNELEGGSASGRASDWNGFLIFEVGEKATSDSGSFVGGGTSACNGKVNGFLVLVLGDNATSGSGWDMDSGSAVNLGIGGMEGNGISSAVNFISRSKQKKSKAS